MRIAIDGELVPPERATISVLDRGVLYGDGVFEVLRAHAGRAVDLDAHLARLADGAAALQLRVPPPGQLAAWVALVLADGDGGRGDSRVRIACTRGPGALARRLGELAGGRTIVIAEPLPPQPTELALATVDWPLPPRRGAGVKALAYLDHVVARELAAAAGADEAIRLDATGRVAECATSNLFIVHRGEVVTPPADTGGVLPGIVRARVLAACSRAAIPHAVRWIERGELAIADEVFITSSLRNIVAATRVDGRTIARGPITQRLAAEYRLDEPLL
nr:aminotransferase class IV [Kofleriaceae bacterium]